MTAAREPRTRASRSGCLTALYVVLAAGVLLLALGGAGAWLFLRSDTGVRVREAISTGITMTREAARAPGTDALRAAGCAQAMAVPTGRMFEMLGDLVPEARAGGSEAGPFAESWLVLCQVESIDTAPGCSAVARIYAEAVTDAPERFGVVVRGTGRRSTVCEGSYSRDGTRLEPPGPGPP